MARVLVSERLRRAADDSELVTAFLTTPLDRVAALALLERAVQVASSGAEEPFAFEVELLPRGPTVLFEEPDDLEEALESVARQLARRGCSGSLDLHPDERPPIPVRADLIETRLRLAGAPARRGRWMGWGASDEAIQAICRLAVPWCLQPGGDSYLDVFVLHGRIDAPGDLPLLLLAALRATRRYAHVAKPLGVSQVAGEDFRQLVISPHDGTATLIDGGPHVARDPLAAVAGMPRLLVEAAPYAVYGYVKRGGSPGKAALDTSLAYDWVPVPHFHPEWGIRAGGVVEARAILDAFGLQLLGPGHLDRLAASPSRWQREHLVADGQLLLEHASLDAWYSNPRPADEVVAEARADLAALLVSDEIVQASSERLW